MKCCLMLWEVRRVFWIPWSTGCVFLRHALQCGLLHLWVRKFMVLMVTGVTLPGRCGYPGRAAFTKVLERVGFLRCKTWCGEGKRVERGGPSDFITIHTPFCTLRYYVGCFTSNDATCRPLTVSYYFHTLIIIKC